jgi:hypothetical protein
MAKFLVDVERLIDQPMVPGNGSLFWFLRVEESDDDD